MSDAVKSNNKSLVSVVSKHLKFLLSLLYCVVAVAVFIIYFYLTCSFAVLRCTDHQTSQPHSV